MAVLEHLGLFVLVCFLSTIAVAAYHEDEALPMLRSAVRRTTTLSLGCLVLVGIILALEWIFGWSG